MNYEVNRINNEIIKSPYQIEDITINVGVESDPNNPNRLAPAIQENIRNIVSNTVRTALGHPDLAQDEIDQRVTVFPHTFAGQTEGQNPAIASNWIYIIVASLLGIVLLVGFIMWLVKRKQKQAENEESKECPTLHRQWKNRIILQSKI